MAVAVGLQERGCPDIQCRRCALFIIRFGEASNQGSHGHSDLVLAYPVVQATGLVPVEEIKGFFEDHWGADRADSVMTRFENEEKLLKRARDRIVFGWGSFCRPCTFDPYTGEEISIRDGDWIISIGDWGIVGFLSKFFLLLFPIFLLRKYLMSVPKTLDRRLLSALALAVAVFALDLLPNGNYHLLPFVLSGALYGSTLGILREGGLS